jgi:hypothetical protein
MSEDKDYDRLYDLMRETREEMKVMRDNHLAHIADDLGELRTTTAVMSERLKSVENFKEEMEGWWKDYARKTIGFVMVAAFGATSAAGMM